MREGQSAMEAPGARRRLWPKRKRWQFLSGIVLLLVGLLGYAWFSREEIARDIIADELERLGIPATYTIRSIGPEWQVLSNVVLGDPARPDFTAEQVSVRLAYGIGAPGIADIKLRNPRLYGSYREGELSFGALDAVIFAESEEPAALPDMRLDISDGRALIETDYGDIGITAEGSGLLSDGFTGKLAASAPRLDVEGCAVESATLFGDLSTRNGQPSFTGPVRLRDLACKDGATRLAELDWQLELSGDADFTGLDAGGALSASQVGSGAFAARDIEGNTRFSLREEILTSRFDLEGKRIASDYARLDTLVLDGDLRAASDFSRVEADIAVEGENLAPSGSWDANLRSFQQGAAETLAEPLIGKLRRGLARASKANSFQTNLAIRSGDKGMSISAPQALLRDGDGTSLASASQVQVRFREDSAFPRFSGNFNVDGPDLPQIAARMELDESDRRVMLLRMSPYTQGSASLAIPQLTLGQDGEGAIRIDGFMQANGALAADGRVELLTVPVTGRIAPNGGVALWERCARATARAIEYAGAVVARPTLELCPSGARYAVRSGANGLNVNLALSPLELSGSLGESPIAIATGAISYRSARGVSARDVLITLGPEDEQSLFAIAEVSGGRDMAGTFAGANMALDVVPLDVADGAGDWRYEGGALLVENGSLSVSDREEEPRFEALIAQDAALRFEDGTIVANGTLREPFSLREVTKVSLRHDLSSGEGHADLLVEGLVFDEELQPAAGSDVCLNRAMLEPDFRPDTPGLSCLALGIVANVRGSVNGIGRVDWDAEDVTSSGRFATRDADLAAAFGPVEGVSGTVEFTDLLALTTAPNQTFAIRSINPGIEVLNGTAAFSLRDGQILTIEGGSWPFMGGELLLAREVLDFSQPEDRRYTLVIEGLDGARFVEYMELGNISMEGVFDGAVPIIFDTDGNGRIEQGLLVAREPGGNISYVGELTYEDLGAMANFAFQSLRSLDFTAMEVEMNGPLTGEIITRLKFDGVSQGEGASSNFVTRQVAKLPIEFRVNIRADFYSLLTNLQSMYDPAFVRDPRELGLIESDGTRFIIPGAPEQNAIRPEDPVEPDGFDEPAIQPQESETLP